MCSIVDAGELCPPEPEVLSINEEDVICKKCKVSKSDIVLRKKDPYCSECFMINSNHKFRSSLGKHKAIKHQDNVLLAFNGSLGSTVLLNFVKSSFEDTTGKKVSYTPIVLIIDERSLFPDSDWEKVIQTARVSGFKVAVVNLCKNSLHPDTIELDSLIKNDDNSINELFDELNETSAKESLLKRLKHRIMSSAAVALNCSKVLIGDSSSSLAVSLLSGIAEGKGVNIKKDVGFSSSSWFSIKILRPLKDLDPQEISGVCTFAGLNPVKPIGFVSNSENSVFSLTKDFISKLHNGFPSTIPTVLKIGDKLEAFDENEDSSDGCLMCDGVLDTSVLKPSSFQATEFSLLISSKGREITDDVLKSVTMSDKKENLCYSCQITIKKPASEKFKDKIKEFIL